MRAGARPLCLYLAEMRGIPHGAALEALGAVASASLRLAAFGASIGALVGALLAVLLEVFFGAIVAAP